LLLFGADSEQNLESARVEMIDAAEIEDQIARGPIGGRRGELLDCPSTQFGGIHPLA
jgi:hypothetical protein